MDLDLKFKMNERLFLRNPEESELGRNIVRHSIILIHNIGFESFTFKKLASEIRTTEASIYRYFENKHRLLLYIVDWYWSWLEYRIVIQTKNIKIPEKKIREAIGILTAQVADEETFPHIDERLLFEIVMMEGAKAYLTRHVTEDNKAKLFKPYKDLTSRFAEMILEYNPSYIYPRTLASTVIEMAHSQIFNLRYLPSLTDFGDTGEESRIAAFLENLVFSSIDSKSDN